MENFVAANPLEEILLEAQEGRVPPAQLFEALFASQVIVLINQDPGPGGQWTDETSLMILNSASGIPVIAMFSSLGRSSMWPDQSGEFQYALEVDFGWLLNGVMEGVGIVLNPGSTVGVEMAPELVVKLQESLAARFDDPDDDAGQDGGH